jgi:hypothetical protein
VGDRDCLFFGKEITDPDMVDMPNPPKIRVEACIDMASRLPVALRRGQHSVSYSFAAISPGSLALPPDVEALLSGQRQSADQQARKFQRP